VPESIDLELQPGLTSRTHQNTIFCFAQIQLIALSYLRYNSSYSIDSQALSVISSRPTQIQQNPFPWFL